MGFNYLRRQFHDKAEDGMARNQGPLTRQQRRALERAARKAARGAIAVGALLTAGAASAATITVTSLADTAVAGDSQCTLREALNNANGNSDTTGGDCTAGAAGLDTIAFQAGLTGTITLGGTELPQITDSVNINGPGAAVITISGNTNSRIFEVYNSSSTTPIDVNINNLTLTSGGEVYGGAISVDSENLTIDHVVATGNAALDGGAIAFSDYYGATLTITNSTISGNMAGDVGGGIAIYNAHGAITVSNSVISGNTAEFKGGGIYAEYLYAPTSITGSTISGNTATQYDGGGIYASELNADLTISSSTLSGNLAGIANLGNGGALDVQYTYATVYLQHDTFGGPNASDANKAGIHGGAIKVVMADGADFQMSNTHVLNNVAGVATGYYGGGGGLWLEASTELQATATAEVDDSVISGNIADPQDGTAVNNNPSDLGYGGGLFLNGALMTSISGTTISGNTAAIGGGVGALYDYGGISFVNATIANNTAASPAQPGIGGGVVLASQSAASFAETTISGNSAQKGAGGIYAYDSDVTLNNSIVANSTGVPDIGEGGVSTVTSNYTLVENPGSVVLGGTGNITGTDPALGALADNGSSILVGNPNGTQVHPQTELPASSSPVVNAGDPAFTPPPATDERGFPRVQGGRIDMGAVEVAPPAISIGNVSQNEGNSGTTAFNFPVTLSAPSAETVTVNYATADGSATAPSDYASASGTVTFTPGQTAQQVTVNVVGDTTVEPNETFTVNLTSPSANATIGTATGTGTIVNDDAVVANVDLSITKSAGAGPFFATQNLTYSISVNNAGPGSATGVTVTDAIPAGTTFVSATPSQGSCSGTTTVTCNLGTLANAGSASVSLTVTPHNAGPVSNTAIVSSAQTDTNPVNNSSTANVTVHPATDIPALSEWVLMMLGSLLALLGFVKAKGD
ncbi:MAG TPA: Calx-beta domain-containing protein [Thermoanaerobaculia bacterium]|nr:Calx-beta domain-containing protein [Thermoanaerobaculia bacterium]